MARHFRAVFAERRIRVKETTTKIEETIVAEYGGRVGDAHAHAAVIQVRKPPIVSEPRPRCASRRAPPHPSPDLLQPAQRAFRAFQSHVAHLPRIVDSAHEGLEAAADADENEIGWVARISEGRIERMHQELVLQVRARPGGPWTG